MRHRRVRPEPTPQPGLPSGWRELVWQPEDRRLLTRRKMLLWAGRLLKDTVVLLVPGRGTRHAVAALVLEPTPFTWPNPGTWSLDEAPQTLCRVHWWAAGLQTEQCLVDNALALTTGYVTMLEPGFLKQPLPDSAWDYTKRHPDRDPAFFVGVLPTKCDSSLVELPVFEEQAGRARSQLGWRW